MSSGAGAGLEEGELEDSDLEEGSYIPLERPDNFNPPSLVKMQIQDEPDDESPDESPESSGSDSDVGIRSPKIKKKKPKPVPMLVPEPQNKKKYNVWCTAIQEQVLTEELVGCDVTKSRARDFGVEAYDYTIKYRLQDGYVPRRKSTDSASTEPVNNKRTNSDRKNVKLRLGKRDNDFYKKNIKHESRILSDLVISENDPLEEVAADIAEKLSEDKKDLMVRIVEVVGAAKAIQLYQETKKIEEDGGILVMNGYRRRTPGGVYIYLMKGDPDITREMHNQIFKEERKQTKRQRQRAQAEHRNQKVEELKQTLIADSDLPALLSRSETIVSSEHGSNPPPSPATDARDGSDTDIQPDMQDVAVEQHQEVERHLSTVAQRNLEYRDSRSKAAVQYEDDDDDFLEVNVSDEMDMF